MSLLSSLRGRGLSWWIGGIRQWWLSIQRNNRRFPSVHKSALLRHAFLCNSRKRSFSHLLLCASTVIHRHRGTYLSRSKISTPIPFPPTCKSLPENKDCHRLVLVWADMVARHISWCGSRQPVKLLCSCLSIDWCLPSWFSLHQVQVKKKYFFSLFSLSPLHSLYPPSRLFYFNSTWKKLYNQIQVEKVLTKCMECFRKRSYTSPEIK